MRSIAAGLLVMLTSTATIAAEPVKSVVIQSEVPFADRKAINPAIVAECQLPKVQHNYLLKQLNAAGIEAKVSKSANPKSGRNVLLLEIVDAQSSGNALLGHRKSMTVRGKLHQGNKQVATFLVRRFTGGGMGAGFKSSCAVLARAAEAIGRDTAKWLGAPTDGARLGDAR